MKLRDIPKGSPLAYREAVKQVREQLEFEIETCRILLGTDPLKLLDLLADPFIWDVPDGEESEEDEYDEDDSTPQFET